MDSTQLIIAYAFGMLMIYLIVASFFRPLKWLGWVIFNGVLGGLALLVLNVVGNYIGFHIGLNPASALTAGLLGVPGVILLFGLRHLLL